jgi:ClpP class serine protease
MSELNPVTGGPRKPAVRALTYLAQERWAIRSEALAFIREVAARAHEPDFEAAVARMAEREAVLTKPGQRMDEESRTVLRGSTAIVPVTGPIFRYANLFTAMSGASSISSMAREFKAAELAPSVKSIIVNFDTPGGQVNGVSEFAQIIRSSSKPVVAYVGGMACSAGYWLASACGSIVINDTAELGSIGVVTGLWTDKDENFVELVSSQSPGKRPDVRTEEGRTQIQSHIDELADVFIDTVAANRRVSREKVLQDFGRGGVLIGKSAVKAGMADRIGSLESLIAELAGSASNRR